MKKHRNKEQISRSVKPGDRPSNRISEIDNLARFFARKPFLERIESVLAEMGRILCGEAGSGDTTLPNYCHNIVAIFRRTYFKAFPSLADVVSNGGQAVQVGWRSLGRMIGIGLRCLRFERYELEEPNVTPEQEQDVLHALVGKRALPVDDTGWNDGAGKINAGFANWNQTAFTEGADAMAHLNAGVAEGIQGFIDSEGEFGGESNRAGLYWFLLLAWPEVQQMQRACPPVTRTDFAAWLEPFARAGIVGSVDLDQIREVCKDVGLKFKKPGAPRKRKIIGECRKFRLPN